MQIVEIMWSDKRQKYRCFKMWGEKMKLELCKILPELKNCKECWVNNEENNEDLWRQMKKMRCQLWKKMQEITNVEGKEKRKKSINSRIDNVNTQEQMTM